MNQRIIIIAGPNGAGKTTFAREFLPLVIYSDGKIKKLMIRPKPATRSS